MIIDPRSWTPLTQDDSEIEGKLYSRLLLVFGQDPFVSMLHRETQAALAAVIARDSQVKHYGSPAFVERVIQKTPHAKLWSSEFIDQIISCVMTALARRESAQ